MSSQPSHDELKVLLDRVIQKDPEAIRKFCQYYHELVEPVAKGSDPSIRVSDVVQSAFLDIWSNLQHILDEARNIPAFLRTVAYRKLLQKLRKLKADQRLVDRMVAEFKHLDALSAPEVAITAELYEMAMDSLVEETRAMIYARLLGFSWAEIGLFVHASDEAVRKRVERAIEELRQRFDLGS